MMEEKSLHLLILEDNPDDAELAVKELELEGFTLEWSRVDTEKAFKKALSKKPDLILADYKVPSFNGMAALKMNKQLTPEIPLIIFSGTIGEEVAVECMKSGAIDYVLKDRLFRLGPAVKRALEEAEEHRQRKRAEEQIKASLKEKEVLLREIHHRVKNNLQVLSSLLNMQARATKDKDTISILSESQDRISAMALIHTQLYESADLSEINMKGFVDKLFRRLFQSYPVKGAKITPILHIADYPFPISIAMPVGLVVNELLANALQHAFGKRSEGKIEVILSVLKKGKTNLTVSDDGVGLPKGFDINKTRTLGLRLVKILAEDQLKGNIKVVNKEGATFKIEFEMQNNELAGV
jgi:two-component sensor histidine kinase